MKKYEFLDHTADAKIRAYGNNIEEAFVNAGLAVFSILKNPEQVKSRINKKISVKSKDNIINDLYVLKEKVKDMYISGIKGIKQVLPVKKDDEYMILASGTNLVEILSLDFVDQERTRSNDIHEIKEVLGIEAARQAIVNEVYNVIEAQGLNVDLRHIKLVADTMCQTGEIKGITRFGIVNKKSSVLARASFETPIKHVIEASLIGEVDKLTSVVENVMINQPIPIGTGLPGLITKVK